MRFLHISDLHIGKVVNGFSMLDDQRFALEQVLRVASEKQVDGLLLSGDLYDKSAPSAEAVALLDWFFTQAAETGLPCFAIPGNHDSAERVGYAASLLQRQGVYVPAAFNGTVEHFALEDAHGPLTVWLLPFLKPVHVRAFFPEKADEIGQDYTAAIRCVLESCDINSDQRNVLLAHQFVTWAGSEPERSESELSLGGLDNVDASVFDMFDYVALGHIHRPQRIGRDEVRYAGSLLKYSFSEIRYPKSAVLVELGAKDLEIAKSATAESGATAAATSACDVRIELIPLPVLRDMREIRGPLTELVSDQVANSGNPNDYLHVVLTDEQPSIDALARVRAAYPNVMAIDYDNARTQSRGLSGGATEEEEVLSPFDLFTRFYEQQNSTPLSESQAARIQSILDKTVNGSTGIGADKEVTR